MISEKVEASPQIQGHAKKRKRNADAGDGSNGKIKIETSMEPNRKGIGRTCDRDDSSRIHHEEGTRQPIAAEPYVPDNDVEQDDTDAVPSRKSTALMGQEAGKAGTKFDYRSYDPFRTKKRRTTTPEEQSVLEAAFLECKNPDSTSRLALSEKLGMKVESIAVWFQNRRAKERQCTQSKSSGSTSFDTKDPSPPAQRVPVTTFIAQKHPRPKNKAAGLKYSLVEEDPVPIAREHSRRRSRRAMLQPETPPLSPNMELKEETDEENVNELNHSGLIRKRSEESSAEEIKPRKKVQRRSQLMRGETLLR
ncbi:hypothetical protein HDU93_008755 [Gonapodya sp. JEL0774]|nr:hypothetical protein HDU93_008755 [Gonapodya sp. JEL0774]